MSEIITMRDIDTITTEIQTIEGQVQRFAIYGCIEIGKRLVEVKEIVGHGGWGKYLAEKVRYSQQWATNLMNLYKEYGGAQESLFENFANSQSFGNIDVTKHILLLSVPAEEREAFAAEHDAENASTRELQAAIRARDDAQAAATEQTERAEKAQAKAADLENQLDLAEGKILARDETIKQLKAEADVAAKKEADAAGKVDKLTKQLKTAKDAEKAAKEALAEAKAKPEIPEAMMEEMRQQVAADAAAKATENLQKQLEAAQIAAAEAEQRRVTAEEKVAEAEKKAKASSPEVALVGVYLQETQAQFNKMVGAIKKVGLVDPEAGKKLRENVRAKLLPMMEKALED